MLLYMCGADMTGKSTFKHSISEKAARQTRKKSASGQIYPGRGA